MSKWYKSKKELKEDRFRCNIWEEIMRRLNSMNSKQKIHLIPRILNNLN
jgi:hypothetical protein